MSDFRAERYTLRYRYTDPSSPLKWVWKWKKTSFQKLKNAKAAAGDFPYVIIGTDIVIRESRISACSNDSSARLERNIIQEKLDSVQT